MSGTKEGGKKAAETNRKKHGEDFYARIGAMGGKKSKGGGFAYSKKHGLDWHIEAGRKGGRTSRRGKKIEVDYIEMEAKRYEVNADIRPARVTGAPGQGVRGWLRRRIGTNKKR